VGCAGAARGDDGDGDGLLDAAQSLEGADDGSETPGGDELGELGLDALETLDLLVDGAERLLVDDLLGGSRTDDRERRWASFQVACRCIADRDGGGRTAGGTRGLRVTTAACGRGRDRAALHLDGRDVDRLEVA
jgi:hypothetical protein